MALLGLLVAWSAHADPPDRSALDSFDAGMRAEEPESLGIPGRRRDRGTRIVNGEPVGEGFDEVVALGFQDLISQRVEVFCTGSLIHPRWVLTAAHCIIPASMGPPGSVRVVMWGNEAGRYTETIEWAQGLQDPAYVKNAVDVTFDAGLVELVVDKEAPDLMVLNDVMVDDTWVGTELAFFGFGVTGDLLSDAGIKRTTTVPIDEVTFSDVSTYADGTNVCFGDSGGPSTYQGEKGPEQVGISSTVDPGCVGGGAESTRVDVVIDWILQHVPEIITDPDQLAPPEDVEDDEDVTRSWDDLGADEVSGIDGWLGRSPVARGCSHSPGSVLGLLGLLGLLRGRGRRRR